MPCTTCDSVFLSGGCFRNIWSSLNSWSFYSSTKIMQILLIVTHLLFFINPKQHFPRSSSNNYPISFCRLTKFNLIASLSCSSTANVQKYPQTLACPILRLYMSRSTWLFPTHRHQSNNNLPLLFIITSRSSSRLSHIITDQSTHTTHTLHAPSSSFLITNM